MPKSANAEKRAALPYLHRSCARFRTIVDQ